MPYTPRITDEPEVVRIAMEYKASLSNLTYEVVREMTDNWVKVSKGLDEIIAKLEVEMASMANTTRPMTIEWLREIQYYKELRSQVEDAYYQLYNQTDVVIARRSEQAILMGAQQADILTAYSFSSLAPSIYQRLPQSEYEILYSNLRSKTPLDRLLKPLGYETWEHIKEVMESGINTGKPLMDIARSMAEAKNIGFDRALRVARTEILRAHRTATLEQYRYSGVVKGFKRLANRRKACISCLALDGEYFPIRAAFTDHPNGACAMIPCLEGEKSPSWLYGANYFKTLSDEEQKSRMGASHWEAWKEGLFKFDDIISYKHSTVWGDMPQKTPLNVLIGSNT